MANVTGTALDFVTVAIPGLRLIFTASSPAGWASSIYLTKPIVVTPAANGSFSVNLRTSLNISPPITYSCRAEWPDPNFFGTDQGYIGMDLFTGLVVPSAGGQIGDLLNLPPSSTLVWTGPTNNTAYAFWFNPATNDLWSN